MKYYTMNIRHILYRFLLVSLKILLGCLLGCSVVLFFASRSEIVHQEIKKSVQDMFQKNLDCDWDGEIESIDLVFLEITFRNSTILPCDRSDGWSMYVDKFHATASWIYFLWSGKFSCHSYFEQVVVHDKQVDGVSKFHQVLSKMFASQASSMVSYDFTVIKQAQMIMQDATGDVQGSYEYNCQTSRESDGIHTKLYIIDGEFDYQGIKIVENFFGNFIFVFPYDNDLAKIYARADCRLSIPELQEKGACFFKGDLYNTRGACILSNDDQSFIIEPLKFRLKKHSVPFTCSVSIHSELLQILAMHEIVLPDVSGDITLTVMGNLLDLASGLQGKIQVQNIAYKNNMLVERAFITFYKEKMGYAAKLFFNSQCIFYGNSTSLQDSWKFDA